LSEAKRCTNCGTEIGEKKAEFTFYRGFALCLDCYKRLQPYPIVRVDEIKIPKIRLRSIFDGETLEQFRESVAEYGVLAPIHVIRDKEANLWLADGEHRLIEAKARGMRLITAVVSEGEEVDAIVGSAKLNLLRGRVNSGDLAELILYLKDNLGWSYKAICKELGLKSEGYVSELYRLAKDHPDLLKAIKEERLSIHTAIEKMRGSTVEPSIEEVGLGSGEGLKQSITTKVSQGTREEKPSEAPQGLTLEDLATPEVPLQQITKDSRSKPEYMTCDFCGKILSRSEVRWLKVHADEYDEALQRVKGGVRDERRAEA
jgi:ParB/RepB/Spo0J family partition protein